MAVRIIIPERTHEEFGHSISKLIRVVENIGQAGQADIILDFSGARMLNPFFLGGLSCAIRYYESRGSRFQLNHSENVSVASYLERIYFPHCYDTNSNELALERFADKTYTPIIKFPTGESSKSEGARNKILSAISDLLKKQLRFSEKQRAPLSYFLDELTHNVNDHSGAEEGYVFGQSYPNSNYLDLCICDHGKGIYRSYLDTNKHHPQTEIEALELAINGRSTKDRPESKGFGIATSRAMLTSGLRGRFFMWTGNSA